MTKGKIHILAAAAMAFVATAGVSSVSASGLKGLDKVRGANDSAVPGVNTRIIVRYRDGSASTVDVGSKLRAVESAASKASLVRSTQGRSASLVASHVRRLGTGADLIDVSQKLSQTDIDRLVTQLKANPDVLYAEPDRMERLVRAVGQVQAPTEQIQFVPNDQFYAGYQWHLHNTVSGINAPDAWDVSRGDGIVVAVLDTGVVPHPDLQANLLEGYDFITNTFVSRRPTTARVPGALDMGDWNDDAAQCDVEDSSWHGTHVSGTVAELTNNGVGMAGVAHNARVLPVRVLGRCGGLLSDITDAIVWASGGTVAGIPTNANPAEVINLSLGGSGTCSAAYQDAINGAVSRGTTVVVAAGNSSANTANFRPANCANVISVGATRVTGGITYYSNWGAPVDLSAPGGGGGVDGNPNGYVWQNWYSGLTTPTSGANSYVGMIGTSMAAPHVAGVVALVQSALIEAERDPLTPAQMEDLLKQTARPFPVSIPAGTPIGTGIVDARAALEKALEVPCDPAVEVCGPVATPITNRVAVPGLSGALGSEALYSLEVPAGATGPLSITTTGGSGDVALLVSFGEEPQVGDADFTSARAGNNETVRVATPQAGTYYIKLVGTRAFSNVRLLATHN